MNQDIDLTKDISDCELTIRAANIICNQVWWRCDGKTTIGDLRRAILDGKLHPRITRHCGRKTWLELLNLAGLPESTRRIPSKPFACPYCHREIGHTLD